MNLDEVLHAAKALILNETGDKFLIIRQYVNDDLIPWNLPGGKLDEGETHMQALTRGVYEELGCRINHIREIDVWDFHHVREKKRVVCKTFSCNYLDEPHITERAKREGIIDMVWVSKREFLEGNYQCPSSFYKFIERI